jgi:Protein kinase domain
MLMSSRPAAGRRPDSLFDNRYRYDYIFPRGRSGETLRAYDTLNDDQPVVIKRPALQDAPPMRAGQERSILTEQRALEKLSGHPVLTELRHVGTFRVGGQTHHYIAVDMAQGVTVESLVLELAEGGERLTELEMLVIVEDLLDLLQVAHERKIVYNDVDAKHLFWDRGRYQLKVIDWGNAIFLDADNAPPHASRAADILQTGQLLYFIVSGGHRLEAGHPDPAADLGENVSPRLKAIINKAAHPEPNQRYADVASLRQDLAELRRPLEKARDGLLERVRSRLSSANSQDQLEQLRGTLDEALTVAPGYPPAVALMAEIETRLKQLASQADLDAVRIYMMSGNMGRASAVLDEIAARMGDTEQPLLNFLLDACAQLQLGLQQQSLQLPLPAGLGPALDALLQNDAQAAARLLLTTSETRQASRLQQYLLAERLTLHIPGVVLLRPHLLRLEDQLTRLSGPQISSQLALVQRLTATLDEPVAPGIQPLLRVYQAVSDTLSDLAKDLKAAVGESPDSAYSSAIRAQRAADDIVDLLDVVMNNVLADPSRAGNALRHAAAIDPVNPAFDALGDGLNTFHAGLDRLRAFTPSGDGADIADFLIEARARLEPYAADISDPQFQALVEGIETARAEWARVTDYIALGGRRPAESACKKAAESLRPLNQPTAHWFDEYVRRIEEAPRVEFLSPNVTLGRALSEGWDSWDRGRGGEAQSCGEKALSVAATDSERRAAHRLVDLSEALASWLSNDGPSNPQRTEQTEQRVNSLLLPEEEAIRRTFAEQMPNMQIYLKAMVKGVVEPMRESSSAAVRALFFDYLLHGILALHREELDEANFWKEAAAKALNQARLHPAFQALETTITRRLLVLEAVRTLNNVKHTADLAEARQAVRAPLASAQLEAAEQAMRAVDDALRRWPDGEFRAARQLLDSAIERIGIAETGIGKDLTPFKTWLQDLAASAEFLQQAKRTIEQAALVPADEPDPAVADAHLKLVDITRRDLGEAYVAQLRQWRDTYNGFHDVYVDEKLSKDEKLHLMDSHFASLFIDRMPALPLYRHWQSVIHLLPDQKPEYVPMAAPAVNVDRSYAPHYDDVVDLDEAGDLPAEDIGLDANEIGRTGSKVASTPASADAAPARPPANPVNTMLIVGGAILVVIAIGVGAFLFGRQPPNIRVTLAGGTSNAVGAGTTQLVATNTLEPPTATPPLTDTALPTVTPIPPTATVPPTITRLVPTPTAPSATPTPGPSPTKAPTVAPSATSPGLASGGTPFSGVPTKSDITLPTLAPDAAGGDYDILKALESLPTEKIPWNKDWFGPGGSGWQLGTSVVKANGGPVIVRLGPDVLTPLFGADAASHLTRIDANLELVSYNPSLLPTGQVSFGIGLESLSGQRASVQAMLVRTNVLDLGMNQNGTFVRKTQLPVGSTVKLAVTVRRNSDNTLTLLVDGQVVGQSKASFAPNTPVTIYMFTSASGVVVNVTSLIVHLD